MALLEEAVTTTMTNCAPLLGVSLGQAYITASSNYFDVILGHSVIVFVPQFAAWAWLLSRYDFQPAEVFLLVRPDRHAGRDRHLRGPESRAWPASGSGSTA